MDADGLDIQPFRVDVPQALLDDLSRPIGACSVGRGATGREDQLSEKPEQPTTVPVGLAQFKRDFRSVRRLADRDHTNIASWSVFDHGSHFAGHDAPQALVTDIRNFFRHHHTRRAADQFNAPAEGQGG